MPVETKGNKMIVALHSAPKGFFKTSLPHSNNDLASFTRKAASLGFRAVQIGPLAEYVPIEGDRLKSILDGLHMERNVHVGGIYDAEKFALTKEEYAKVQKQIRSGITLSKKISSTLVSVHPPFVAVRNELSEELLLKARTRFLRLLKEEAKFASHNHIKIALESFCYHPFIFKGLNDFAKFVSNFPLDKLGVLLELGHLHQAGISLSEAINVFKHRLVDVHVHDATLEKDYKKATHLPIGKGTISFSNVIQRLKEIDYDEWLTLEIRGSEKEIVKSKEHLERLIANKN
jgi:sugar phosphate isomerase/epimerase